MGDARGFPTREGGNDVSVVGRFAPTDEDSEIPVVGEEMRGAVPRLSMDASPGRCPQRMSESTSRQIIPNAEDHRAPFKLFRWAASSFFRLRSIPDLAH